MPATRELAIPIPHEEIATFCRKWGIKRLSFFGSIVRDDFDPERSDVDVLVELRSDTKARGLSFFGAERELSELFDGRKVEMMTGVREAYARQSSPIWSLNMPKKSDPLYIEDMLAYSRRAADAREVPDDPVD